LAKHVVGLYQCIGEQVKGRNVVTLQTRISAIKAAILTTFSAQTRICIVSESTEVNKCKAFVHTRK